MSYDFRCEALHTITKQLSITQQIPMYVECHCGLVAYRVYYPTAFIMKT